ncbi:hypothetical protein [Saccharopolyspora montiporae]|uniref:hypothetical protein n=1 Tax=Saccharopolyspora montiporae TaxID=2781240 RepID=UPI001D1589C5|nr:hypothetical protein [Saccharopolyspora sp. HNM0983]
MVFDVFHRDRVDVFWIVGAGFRIRHAMSTLPGAICAGDWEAALCATWLKIPTATPYGREPASTAITERCTECTAEVTRGGFREHVWDY